jgi:predicted amidohydrolase YtcJ
MSQTVSQHGVSTTVRLADWIIRAGAIYSMAEGPKVHRAIAIRDEWIVAVSEDLHGLDALIGGGTRVTDEPGLTILPAFYDTHQHLINHAESMFYVQVDHTTSLPQFLDLIAQRAAQNPIGQWIITSGGWRESNLAEGRLPTAPGWMKERCSLPGQTTRPRASTIRCGQYGAW